MMINDPAAPSDRGAIEPPGIAARAVRIVLAVYLLPVVLVVLVVAAVGLVALATGRLAARATRSILPAPLVRAPGGHPRLTN